MRHYLNTLDTVEQIIQDHAKDLAIVRAAKKLQEVLLKTALDTVKPVRKNKLMYGLTPQEAATANRREGKIPAIKLYRDRTGCGLKEAKDAVEEYMLKMLGFTYWPAETRPVPDSDGERVDTDGNLYNPYDR
jgi:ribosomal protein L7/L12